MIFMMGPRVKIFSLKFVKVGLNIPGDSVGRATDLKELAERGGRTRALAGGSWRYF